MTDELDDLVAAHRSDEHKAPDHLVQQWHSAIDDAAALERGRKKTPASKLAPKSFFWGMAVTAALALGVAIGFSLSSDPVAVMPQLVAVEPQTNVVPTAFSRGLTVHLRDSKDQLAGLDSDADRATLVLQLIELRCPVVNLQAKEVVREYGVDRLLYLQAFLMHPQAH